MSELHGSAYRDEVRPEAISTAGLSKDLARWMRPLSPLNIFSSR
jgi:hypothetical protein